ncbi:hypothetical protein OSB04_013325 [Centaurea solstitialis]|uniref:S-protein homolog n=1 Tax=Centaurea solstitialis TaxID=347529 RepID=A0AA38WR75_9ASTR|nr:hypothetical protein OSB04_013325 [Centaurea solstitialis]
MKNKTLSLFLIFFKSFLCIIIAVVEAGGCILSTGYAINVVNQIDGPDDKIRVRCKSKDDDIGDKTIGFQQSVDWHFCENVFGPSTLFFCHFYMGNRQQVFDVFNKSVKPQCHEKHKPEHWRCTWLVRRDGFYIVHRFPDVPEETGGGGCGWHPSLHGFDLKGSQLRARGVCSSWAGPVIDWIAPSLVKDCGWALGPA